LEKANTLVIGIYFHPEAYPPTLNAVGELSDCFHKIKIVHRPHLENQWNYPHNVEAIPAGKFITLTGQQNASFVQKVLFFINFVKILSRTIRTQKPSMVLLYDNMSLYAYSFIRPLLRFKHRVWYHNHDVAELGVLRKYSIGWFAAKAEPKAFKYLSLFSLPSNERKKYFPLHTFNGQYFYLPNYPSKNFYSRFYQPRKLDPAIRLIFQGQIGPYHGIEEIIPLLNEKILGHSLELVLKGPCQEPFKDYISQMGLNYGVSAKITFIGVTPYAEVPVAGSKCHIGIGILAKGDIMNTTLGTASNKLYEYAALGLPVIYYNSDNFTRFLGKFSWAVPVNVTTEDIKEKITAIIGNYQMMSENAHKNFLEDLNFEKGFALIKAYLKSST
jgi:hypothetical protein